LQISKILIENFRCFQKIELQLGQIAALIGENNTGKSTILSAIDLFYSTKPRVSKKDYHRHNDSTEISITITFERLTPSEVAEFGSSLIDNKLTVTRQFGGLVGGNGTFSVTIMTTPEIAKFFEEENGTKRRTLYSELRDSLSLPPATGSQMEFELKNWLEENPKKLTPSKVKGFWGAPNVAIGKLRKHTSVRLIPAAQDIAGELDDPKESPIIALLNDVREQTLHNKEEYKNILGEASERLRRFNDELTAGLSKNIGQGLTDIVQNYYPDTTIEASFPSPTEYSPPIPPARLQISHRSVTNSIESLGHGLQRAILFSVVQYLAEQTPSMDDQEEFSEAASDIIVLIEEPELYQHPLKQRIIHSALQRLVDGFNKTTGIRFQIIFCTHSEKFVEISRMDNIRVLRCNEGGSGDLSHSAGSLSMQEFRDLMFKFSGAKEMMKIDAFASRLHIFTLNVSEGFFAQKVILVEGVSDKAIVEGYYRQLGRDIELDGICVICVDGKGKLDRPATAFHHLGIPSFVVFDNDQAKNGNQKQAAKSNRLLQRVCGLGEDCEDFPEGVFERYAAFPKKLEKYLSDTTDKEHDVLIKRISDDLGVSGNEALKSPMFASIYIEQATSKGIKFEFLEKLTKRVDELTCN
jgi:predicted ATP-dependent endonuclease of OLD family